MAEPRDEARAIDALDGYWERVLRGEPAGSEAIAPDLAATVRWVHALPDAPGPDPAFVARLEEKLMTPSMAPTLVRSEGAANGAIEAGWPLAPATPVRRPVRPRVWWRALEGLAAAALALVLVAGLAVGWRLLPERGERPATVPAIAQAAPGAAVVPGAAMERGNAARTGEVAGPGPDGEPERRWEAPIAAREDGWIRSAPVVVDGVAYVVGNLFGSAPEGAGAGHVFALDATTGAERWRAKVVEASSGGEHEYVEVGNPAVADGMLYVGTAVEVDVGRAMPEPEVEIDPETGEATALAVEVETSGTLVALDARSGAEQWRVPTGKSGWLSPAVADGVVYVSVEGAVLALDALTGAERWRSTVGGTEPSEDGEVWLGSPAVGGGLVYVSEGAGIVHALDARTGAERWRFAGERDALSDPVVAEGTVYVASSSYDGAAPEELVARLHALDAATGAPRWLYETDAHVWGPTVGAGVVSLISERGGSSEVIGLDAASGEERWSTSVEGWSADVPVLAGGRLYFGTYEAGVVDLGAVGDFLGLGDTSYLYALDAASGDRVWRIETEVGTTAPAIAEGTAYLVEGGGDGAGTLIAYGDD